MTILREQGKEIAKENAVTIDKPMRKIFERKNSFLLSPKTIITPISAKYFHNSAVAFCFIIEKTNKVTEY